MRKVSLNGEFFLGVGGPDLLGRPKAQATCCVCIGGLSTTP